MIDCCYNYCCNVVIDSDEAEVTEIKEVILDRHYYDESFLQKIGMAASEKLGKLLYIICFAINIYNIIGSAVICLLLWLQE